MFSRDIIHRKFVGAWVFLTALVFTAAVVGPVIAFGEHSRRQPPHVPTVAEKSNAVLLGELGEAAQVGACPIQEGLTGRIFVDEGNQRLVVICTAQ